ncbi:MAG: GNAT family N-acetyltransferase [Pseudomonadota bacterium]
MKTFSDINIRSAISDENSSVFSLIQACIRHMQSQGIDQWDELYPDLKTVENDIQQATSYVALYDQKIIGTFILNDIQEPEYAEVSWQFTQGPTAVIHRLMTHPLLEGQGLARLLMEFAEQEAMNKGYQTIRLDAFTQNPRAVRFYERLGYSCAGNVQFRKGSFFCFEKELIK